MRKIRVLVGSGPWLPREIIRDMACLEHDIEIVGDVSDPVELLVAVRDTNAHAVVVSARDPVEHGLVSHLLAEYPDLIVVTLARECQVAFIEQRCPQRREISFVSAENILQALRQAAGLPDRIEKERAGRLH